MNTLSLFVSWRGLHFLSQLLVPEEFASRGSENSRKLLTLKVKNRVRVLGSGQDRPLSEPNRLQDLEGSARSQAWKKIKSYTLLEGAKIKFSEKKIFRSPETHNIPPKKITRHISG